MKSVQRGSTNVRLIVYDSDSEKTKSMTIPISPVNISKSILLLFGDNINDRGNNVERTITFNTNSIVFTLKENFYTENWYYEPLFWQVIEFY